MSMAPPESFEKTTTIPPLATLHVKPTDFEIEVLEEFLNEDTSMSETIDNLKQLLAHNNLSIIVATATLFNLRRALVSLETLSNTMGLK